MTSRPRLLDLFCGAGGCSVGYYRAGFDVVGVDRDPHPDYPYRMVEADALAVLADRELLAGFDVIHASPPCQGYTTMSNRWRGAGGKADEHDNLIAEVRHYLEAWGGIYVIENVDGARRDMRHPIRLRGGMFGLGVDRPRLFEANVELPAPPLNVRIANPIGVYGKSHDGRRLFTRKDGSIQRAARTLEEGQRAMGIDWMQWHDLTEAIPPAYTEWVGERLQAHLGSEVAA